MAAALRYAGADFPWVPHHAHGREWRLNMGNTQFMAATGMSFSLLWREGWHNDNVDLMFIADPRDIIRRGFASAGYTYEVVEKTGAPDDEAHYRHQIRESIRRGLPVLAFGVVGPPECCLITGFDEGGDVAIGWNYFQDDPAFAAGVEREPSGYFRKRGWFANTHSLVLIGARVPTAPPDDLENLRWALSIARTPMVMGRHAGLAAYSAWAHQLMDDNAFAGADEAVLRQRHDVHNSAVGTLAECRWTAALWMAEVAKHRPDLADELLAAADLYNAEHDLMWKVWDQVGGSENPDGWRSFAKPEVRRRIAPLILQSRELDEQAAAHLERALV